MHHTLFASRQPLRRSRRRGFSLIELLITLAIVAILLALALPSYTRHMRQARRIDARSALLELAGRQETFFAMNNRYARTAADLGYASLPWAITSSGSTSYYELSLSVDVGDQGYSALASPSGSQAEDTECFAYTLSHTGAKGNRDAAGLPLTGNACW